MGHRRSQPLAGHATRGRLSWGLALCVGSSLGVLAMTLALWTGVWPARP